MSTEQKLSAEPVSAKKPPHDDRKRGSRPGKPSDPPNHRDGAPDPSEGPPQ